MQALATPVSEQELTTFLPDAFIPAGSVPQSGFHNLKGATFWAVSALVTNQEGKVLIRSSARFPYPLDYPVFGPMRTVREASIRDRHESAEGAFMREAQETWGDAFARYLQDTIAQAPRVVFAPDPANGMPFWEYLVLLLGVPEKSLPVFGAGKYESDTARIVPFNESLEYVRRYPETQSMRPGLARSLQYLTQTRVEKLMRNLISE